MRSLGDIESGRGGLLDQARGEVHEAAGVLDWTPAVGNDAAGILDQSRRASRKISGDIGSGRGGYCIRSCGVVDLMAPMAQKHCLSRLFAMCTGRGMTFLGGPHWGIVG